MKASTSINLGNLNNFNFPHNPILSHPLNSNNYMMNNMSNMNNLNNMSMNPNINLMNNMNNLNNMSINPNMNPINNMNNLNNMSMNPNMNPINNYNNLNNMSMNPNINPINNINNLNNISMSVNPNINPINNRNNLNNVSMSVNPNINPINNFNNMNNNTNNNLNNLNMNNVNNQNNMMMSMQNLQINRNNQMQNNNQGQGNKIINNKIQCILCYNKVNKPKRCKFCSQLYCTECITKWLSLHDYCQNCKQKLSDNDIVNVSLDEDMSNYTKKISLDKAAKNKNRHKSMVFGKVNQQGNNINNNILNNNYVQENINQNYCQTHKTPFEYYCVQCGQYYCSNCFVFFGQETSKHNNHFILKISQMNDRKIKELISEFKKLSDAKFNMNNLIGLSNYKLRENYIKSNQFDTSLNIIKEQYFKKIDESFNDLDSLINELKAQKEKIETSIGSIPNGFNNIVKSNDHVQGGIISQELKKLNKIDSNLENKIKQMEEEIQQNIFVENYQSDIIQIPIPYGGQYNEGMEIFNKNINFIPNNNSLLVIKYLQNKIYVSLAIDINAPLNSIELPKFYCFITIQNQNFGLEFNNLLNQNLSQQVVGANSGRANLQQINSNEFDFGQMIFMSGNDKIIKMKIYVMKVYFKK